MIKKISILTTISRDSNDIVNIRIKDRESVNEFLVIQLTLEQYALIATGLSCVESTAEIRNLHVVGKRRITEGRSVKYTGVDRYNTEELEEWILNNCAEEGWIINPALRSQGSVNRHGKSCVLFYSVFKYIDIEEICNKSE